ncbi:DUF2536 family protein [Paenibacillus rigui]|uniref:DUF2536 domain-containing protein n=1 Tax=Paenibacillus rigui TaxID=554312 RepID=A0A229UHB6_9BACL|nr:DUF2536 family protein [Paenibacillus rigui]OXM82740.1 hypothetical protein CF651_29160 [Paenibacillus rigui]
MEFIVDKIETKVEFFEAYDLKTLERKIEAQMEMNKALLLDIHAVQHQVTFDPHANKMLYTALVHYKIKK